VSPCRKEATHFATHEFYYNCRFTHFYLNILRLIFCFHLHFFVNFKPIYLCVGGTDFARKLKDYMSSKEKMKDLSGKECFNRKGNQHQHIHIYVLNY